MKAGFEYCKRDDAFYLLVNDGKSEIPEVLRDLAHQLSD
jgi:hypothetical protein